MMRQHKNEKLKRFIAGGDIFVIGLRDEGLYGGLGDENFYFKQFLLGSLKEFHFLSIVSLKKSGNEQTSQLAPGVPNNLHTDTVSSITPYDS